MGKEKGSVTDVFQRLADTYYNWRRRKEKLDTFLTDNVNLSHHIKTIDANIATLNGRIATLEDKVDVLDARIGSVQTGVSLELFESLRDLWKLCVYTQGYASIEQKEQADNIYRVYHNQLGGNGVGTHLYEEIINLPVKEL